jgi:hypothetical protein
MRGPFSLGGIPPRGIGREARADGVPGSPAAFEHIAPKSSVGLTPTPSGIWKMWKKAVPEQVLVQLAHVLLYLG